MHNSEEIGLEDLLVDLAESFVYENQKIQRADVVFISRLIEEHYDSILDKKDGNQKSCDIAWGLAQEVYKLYIESEDVSWMNLYFVIDSFVDSIEQEFMNSTRPEQSAIGESIRKRANSWGLELDHLESTDENNFELQEFLNEIVKTINLYKQEWDSEYDLSFQQEMSIFFHTLQKRFNYEPYKEVDVRIGFHFSKVLTELNSESNVSKKEIHRGASFVRDWLKQRAKLEHKSLSVV